MDWRRINRLRLRCFSFRKCKNLLHLTVGGVYWPYSPASSSQVGRFETQVLTKSDHLALTGPVRVSLPLVDLRSDQLAHDPKQHCQCQACDDNS